MTNTLFVASSLVMLVLGIFCVWLFVTYADKKYEKLCLSGAVGLFSVFTALGVCSLFRVDLYAKNNVWSSVVLFVPLILSIALIASGLIILGWNKSIQSIKKKLLDELKKDMNLGVTNTPVVQTPPSPTAAQPTLTTTTTPPAPVQAQPAANSAAAVPPVQASVVNQPTAPFDVGPGKPFLSPSQSEKAAQASAKARARPSMSGSNPNNQPTPPPENKKPGK